MLELLATSSAAVAVGILVVIHAGSAEQRVAVLQEDELRRERLLLLAHITLCHARRRFIVALS